MPWVLLKRGKNSCSTGLPWMTAGEERKKTTVDKPADPSMLGGGGGLLFPFSTERLYSRRKCLLNH